MPSIDRVTFVWNGFTGAPGYTNLYFDSDGDAGAIGTALNAFWNGMKVYLSTATTVSLLEAAQIDVATGDLQATVDLSGIGPWVGQAGAESAAPAGACITWRTGTIVNGRRLRGRTFLVPLAANQYQGNGTLASPDQIQAKAQDLIDDSGALVVWHRPTTPSGSDGSASPATTAYVRDRVSVLRSRAK